MRIFALVFLTICIVAAIGVLGDSLQWSHAATAWLAGLFGMFMALVVFGGK